jgi:S-methylmethionine-dependent homocysteine/selenocysteine methylase
MRRVHVGLPGRRVVPQHVASGRRLRPRQQQSIRSQQQPQCHHNRRSMTVSVASSLASASDVQPGWGRRSARETAGLMEVMDGGMGSLLLQTGVPRDAHVWSARCLEPAFHGNVIAAHCLFIEAGATIITTSNYGVQPTYYRRAFGAEGSAAHMARDTETAARLAMEARFAGEAFGKRGVRVFGCLPPLCESHRPDLGAAFLEAEGEANVQQIYGEIVQALMRGGPVDGFIIETANTWPEVLCAVAALEDQGLAGMPVIISMQGALLCPLTLLPQPHLAAEFAQRALELKLGPRQLPIEAFGALFLRCLFELLIIILAGRPVNAQATVRTVMA